MKNTNDLFNFLPKEIDAFLLTTSDEFLGEYVPNYSQRLKFVTGFSGSVGFAIIVKNGKSKLFVDGRYTLQAENECGKDYDIFDITLLFKELKNHKFAIDGRFYSLNFIENLKERGMNFEIINQCPLDEIWKRDIIFECKTENFELAGETKEEKLAKVRNFLKENNADALFLHDPHDICYAFNIRGNYLEFSPIIPFFAFISRESEGLVAPKDVPNLKLGKVLLSKSASFSSFSSSSS